MSSTWNDLGGKIGNLAAKWSTYAALGTFLLYLLGYLTLRFQLNTYGVATNLDVLDEKYLFAGCRFLVFFAMTIPTIMLILGVVFLPLYGIYRLTPAQPAHRLNLAVRDWFGKPGRLQIVGCVFALVLIQVVLRQCVLLNNMLLRDRKPDFWIASVLMAGDFAQAMYFTGLVLGAGLTLVLLACALRSPVPPSLPAKLSTGLLIFLMFVEFLLLPINYGVLISSTSLPRVSQIGNGIKLPPPSAAWLLWDSKEVLTYLLCDNQGRTLITIPRKDNQIAIIGYDAIFPAIFSQQSCSASK